MNCKKNNKAKSVFIAIFAWMVLFITIFLVWYSNHLIPFMQDDDWYATLLYSNEKVTNIKDIFQAQKWHYMNWGGRSINHTLLQIVLLLGEDIADIVNTAFFVLTAAIITFFTETMTYIKRSVTQRIMCMDAVMGLLLGLSANWKMSMLWQSGAANYLYITVFILLFMWVYMRELPYDCFGSRKPLWGVNVWIVPLALLAGWSNENMGPVAFLLSVATIIYVKKVNHNVEVWMIEGSFFSFVGSATCILAPGNFVRKAEVTSSNYGILWKSYLHGYYESVAVFEYLFPTLLVCTFVFVLYKAICISRVALEERFIFTAAFLSWFAMILSPHYPDRATYGTMVLVFVGCIALAQHIFEKKPIMRKYMYFGALFIWLRGLYRILEFVGINWGWIL